MSHTTPDTEGKGAAALLPCPFCGGSASYLPDPFWPRYECLACPVEGPPADTQDRARVAWNSRAPALLSTQDDANG